MRSDIRTKEDVERSYHQGLHGLPMVNVKVYGNVQTDGWHQFRNEEDADPEFNEEWLAEHITDEHLDRTFWHVCEFGWEMLQSDAEEIFGQKVTVEPAGRSGGWAVVRGLEDIEEWDAVALAKWRKFARWARAAADAIPGDMIQSVYINEFEWQKTEDAERERAANQEVATHG